MITIHIVVANGEQYAIIILMIIIELDLTSKEFMV